MKKAVFLVVIFVSCLAWAETETQKRFSFCLEGEGEILCFQCQATGHRWVACRYLQGGENPNEEFNGDIFWEKGMRVVPDSQPKIMKFFQDEKTRKEAEEKIKQHFKPLN